MTVPEVRVCLRSLSVPGSFCLISKLKFQVLSGTGQLNASRQKRDLITVQPGILNTWIGNEADIRLNYGTPNFHPKSEKRKATLSKLVSF